MRTLVPVLILGMAACGGPSVTSEVTRMPSGNLGLVIECKRPALCFLEAGNRCPTGYEVVAAGTDAQPDAWANAWEAAGANQSGRPARMFYAKRTTFMVECRASRNP